MNFILFNKRLVYIKINKNNSNQELDKAMVNKSYIKIDFLII